MALSVNRPLTYHIIQLMCRARRRPRVQRLRWHRRASRPPACVATYHGRRRMLAVAHAGRTGVCKRRMQAALATAADPAIATARRAVARPGVRPPFCRAPHRSQPSPLSPSAADPLNSAPAGVPRPTPAGDKPDRRRPSGRATPLAAPVCLVAEDASPAVLGMANYSIALLGTRKRPTMGVC